MDLRSFGPSVIRTVTPWVVGVLVTLVGRAGLEWHPSAEAVGAVSGIVAAGYYALVRLLEERVSSSWGWALGSKGAPVYPAEISRAGRAVVIEKPPPATGAPRGLVVWGWLLAVAAVLETYGIVHPGPNDTLTEFTRAAFGVDQTVGRWVFGLGWTAFAGWFLVHILGTKRKAGD